MTTLENAMLGSAPLPLSYATPQPKQRSMVGMGIVSIIIGLIFSLMAVFLQLATGAMGAMYIEMAEKNNYANPYLLLTLGLASMLLGNVTLIRAGIMAICRHPKAAAAHRLYARLQFYGVAAVIASGFWIAGTMVRDRMEWFALSIFLFIGVKKFLLWVLVSLLYPVVVVRLPMFKKNKSPA
jgi:hypothetical protein